MFSSTLVIAVAFIPLFTLTGVAGVIFSPMAHTYAFAIGGAIVLALTLTPVLAERVLKLPEHEIAWTEPGSARRSPSWEGVGTLPGAPQSTTTGSCAPLKRFYVPLFAFSLRHKRAAVDDWRGRRSSVSSGGRERRWGASSCPSSRRGTSGSAPRCRCRSRSSSRRSTSAACARSSSAAQDVERCDLRTATHPEITTVVSQLGRPDDGTDVSGFYNIELFAPLKPSKRVAARRDQGVDDRRALQGARARPSRASSSTSRR